VHTDTGAWRKNRVYSAPPQAAKCFPEMACPEIPENFPQTESSEHAHDSTAARSDNSGEIPHHGRQVRDAIHSGKIRQHTIVRFLQRQRVKLLYRQAPEANSHGFGRIGALASPQDHSRGGIAGVDNDATSSKMKRVDSGSTIDFENRLSGMKLTIHFAPDGPALSAANR